jgi:aminoglycoside 6-adenylyltransferase
MGELFRRIAIPVAQHFGYSYPHGDDQRVSAHLRHIRYLPRDAPEMY